MPERTDQYASEYVDDAWSQDATPKEAQEGLSENVSRQSYPSAFRLGQMSPYAASSHVADNYLPYRGSAQEQHGVTQLFAPMPPDADLEFVPSDMGPAIGGEAAGPPTQFPQPTPVQVVSMPEPNNIPVGRSVQQTLPPREGINGIPKVIPIAGREQNRTHTWFAADNHMEDDPGVPYCVHITFDRDRAQFVANSTDAGSPAVRSYATDGIPLMSNGMHHGPVAHTEGIFSFNTESFVPEFFEFYLTRPSHIEQALWMIPDMTADEYFAISPSLHESSQRVRSAVNRIDFLDAVLASKFRRVFCTMQYSSQVG